MAQMHDQENHFNKILSSKIEITTLNIKKNCMNLCKPPIQIKYTESKNKKKDFCGFESIKIHC